MRNTQFQKHLRQCTSSSRLIYAYHWPTSVWDMARNIALNPRSFAHYIYSGIQGSWPISIQHPCPYRYQSPFLRHNLWLKIQTRTVRKQHITRIVTCCLSHKLTPHITSFFTSSTSLLHTVELPAAKPPFSLFASYGLISTAFILPPSTIQRI